MTKIVKSLKMANICYDIRGPALREAKRLEDEGHKILKLNTGNPAAFGLDAPEEIIQDMIRNLPQAQGYCDSKGLFSARKAIMQDCQKKNLPKITLEDIVIGNGVSELIVMAMQALLNHGDEVLIPAPDYPLWTAAVNLCSGRAVHYIKDEQSEWYPDINDIQKKITSKTRAIVVINPNNPTGAVYPKELLEQIVELARRNNLIIYADEIYDRILYDGVQHTPMATLAEDVLCITFNGLSKSYRAAGLRAGWLVASGARHKAVDYMEGLEMLASMRLCANVPSQFAIQTALGGYQSIKDLVIPGGRLLEQRNKAWEMLEQIPGVSCVKPKGALYVFPRLDPKRYSIKNDEKLILDLLLQEKVLLVQGSAFNWPEKNHLRLVTLPRLEELEDIITRLARFLGKYKQ
ncbi:MAG: pyridoxal phosphate-dependent aminotransferase [Endozoicomonas sp. (ex Botrylloides leachii)]|nr:pyridoxal phosphate-dependent aminotransferase [Endozoicomonas sp. (ex Botrylloides leachii)]